MALLAPTLAHTLTAIVLVGSFSVAAEANGPSGDDVCFPDRFSVRYSIYLPDTPTEVRSLQQVDLSRSRERFDTFDSPTQFISFLDDFDTDTRYILLGTHQNEEIISIDQCFPSPLERVLEPVCVGTGMARQESFSLGPLPVHRSILNTPPPNESVITVDATWSQIGTTVLPLISVERQPGSSLQFIRFDNLRFEFDPTILDIPDLCTTAQAQSTEAPTPKELFPAARWEQLRSTLPFRRLLSTDE